MSDRGGRSEASAGDRSGLLRTARIPIALVWLAAAASFLWPATSGLAAALRLVFWAMLAVHAVECVVLLPTLRRSGRPLAGQLARVMLFGVVHLGMLRAEEARRAAGADA